MGSTLKDNHVIYTYTTTDW